jgi:hypothetical protein
MPRRIHVPTTLLVPAILLAALLHAPSVRAEVRIAGGPDAVQVEARDAPIEEVLAALGTSFGLHYRGTGSLNRRVTGTYKGPLQSVVRRVLEGYNFTLKTNADNLEVVVIGASKPGEARPGPEPRLEPVNPTVRRRHPAAAR